MIGEQIGWSAGHPLRKIDRLIIPCVQTDQHSAGLAAGVLDGMSIALRDVRHVALKQRLDPVATVRSEQTDAELPVDDILSLVRVGVPVQFAQAARVEIEDDASNGLRNGKAALADPPFAAEFVDRMGFLGQ